MISKIVNAKVELEQLNNILIVKISTLHFPMGAHQVASSCVAATNCFTRLMNPGKNFSKLDKVSSQNILKPKVKNIFLTDIFKSK